MVWHIAFVPSCAPVFFSQHAYVPYTTIRDHGASEQPHRNQRENRLQLWASCARRDGVSAGAAPAGARGQPMAAAPPVEGGRGGVEYARRLGVRDKLGWDTWCGKQHSFLLASTPYFFHSTLTLHSTRYGITEYQNSRAQVSRKIRQQAWAGWARRDGVRAAAAPGAPAAGPWQPQRLWNGSCGCETRSATWDSRQSRLASLAWHTGIVPSRRDPAFFPKQALITYNTIRDHIAPDRPRKNQQKL